MFQPQVFMTSALDILECDGENRVSMQDSQDIHSPGVVCFISECVQAFHVRPFLYFENKTVSFPSVKTIVPFSKKIFNIQGVFCDWCPPKKLKYGKPRLDESTST